MFISSIFNLYEVKKPAFLPAFRVFKVFDNPSNIHLTLSYNSLLVEPF